MHAHVDKGTERGDVGDHPFQHHVGGEIGEGVDTVGEGRGRKRRARVTARLLQFRHDVGDRRQAEGVVDEVRGPQRAQQRGVADQGRELAGGRRQDAPDHRIRLRVHAGGVERVVPVPDAQEAGALFERFRAEPWDVGEGPARAERAVGVTVAHDVLREPAADARDSGQQRGGGGVDVDADGVHRILDDRVQRAGQFDLGEVMLVLADPDRLRVDLDEFGQRVLQTARDRHRAAQRHIQFG